MKKRKWFIMLCFFALLFGCGNPSDDGIEIELAEQPAQAEAEVTQKAQLIVVYICGEVKNPGVYKTEENCRIADLLDLAGGPLPDADLGKINLAQKLNDGQQVIVPSIETQEESLSPESSSGRVNLNYATKEELMTLPGIGESKAEAILAYRSEVGWITSAEEIMNVSGIKEKMYERIADRIEV